MNYVGISVTNPSYNLHVLGPARIEGNLIVNGTTTTVNTTIQNTDQFTIDARLLRYRGPPPASPHPARPLHRPRLHLHHLHLDHPSVEYVLELVAQVVLTYEPSSLTVSLSAGAGADGFNPPALFNGAFHFSRPARKCLYNLLTVQCHGRVRTKIEAVQELWSSRFSTKTGAVQALWSSRDSTSPCCL